MDDIARKSPGRAHPAGLAPALLGLGALALAGCATPPAKWKRIDAFGDALPERDVAAVAAAGAALTFDDYMADVAAGKG